MERLKQGSECTFRINDFECCEKVHSDPCFFASYPFQGHTPDVAFIQ
jgi:hypothetical protein